jgi:hypothetical protein
MQLIASAILITVLVGQLNPVPSAPSGGQTETDRKGIRIEGLVLSAAGDPLRGADVRLQPSVGYGLTTYRQSTDTEGKFVFEAVVPGRYKLVTQKQGFLTRRGDTAVDLNELQSVTPLVIKMTSQAVVTGRITDQLGDVVANAQIKVFRLAYVRGRRQLAEVLTATANDLGEYRAAGLLSGHYFVAAMDQRVAADATPQESNVSTFYPNALTHLTAVPLELVDGSEVGGVNIVLRRERVYALRGRAIAVEASIPRGLMLELLSIDSASPATRRGSLRPGGAFEFLNLPAGRYVLQPPPGSALTGRLQVTIADKDAHDALLQLAPAGEITGNVRVEGGELQSFVKPAGPQSMPVVAAIATGSRLALTFGELEGDSSNARIWPIQDDGTFKIQGVTASKYVLKMNNLPAGMYMKSVLWGGREVTQEFIDTTNGVSGTLDIVLSPKAADLAGMVTAENGEPKSGVTVTLWSRDTQSPSGVRTTTTDQSGRFRLEGLPAGDYNAVAWDEIEPGLATYPEFLARFNAQASSVLIAEGEHRRLDLRPIDNDKVLAETARLP